MQKSCICCSGKTFAQCCGRFLGGDQLAKTPEQLMRSRYSAYALGNHGKYLLQSWFPATARNLTELGLSQRSHEWTRLDILAKSQQDDKGVVEFNAWYREKDGSEHVLHEKSVFQRVAGRWLYVGGEVSDSPASS